jgi:hypothetical protein
VEGIRRDPKVCFLASVEDNVAIEFSPKDVIWVKGSVGSTSVLHWLHAIAQCNNSFLFYVRFYNSELHISFVRARGCGLRH